MSEAIEALRRALAEAHERGGSLAIVSLDSRGWDDDTELCFFGDIENADMIEALLDEMGRLQQTIDALARLGAGERESN